MAGYIPNANKDAELSTILGNGPWNSTMNVHLFTNNITVDGNTIIGSMTEATFSGYTPQAANPWGVTSGGPGGTSSALSAIASWNPGTLGSPQDCYGWYVTDGGGNLIGSGNFTGGPKNMGGGVTLLTIQLQALLS